MEEAVLEVYLLSLGGNKDLYLQIMHFLGSALVWALHTLAKRWVLCFASMGRAKVGLQDTVLQPDFLLSGCVTLFII